MWTLITGAGSGIGRALAFELAQLEHNLILAGRTESKLVDVASEVGQASPRCKIVTQVVELTDAVSTRELAVNVGKVTDHLDAFVHCAGVGEPAATLATLDLTDFQNAFSVNVSSPLLLSQTLLPVLTGHNPASRIIMLGAGMDKHAQPGTGSYGVTKMALRRLVQQLSVEFQEIPMGPAAALFQPGLVDTPGILRHIQKAEALNLPHARWLSDRLESGDCLTAEQAASALAYCLLDVPQNDFQGAVFQGKDLVDSLFFSGS